MLPLYVAVVIFVLVVTVALLFAYHDARVGARTIGQAVGTADEGVVVGGTWQAGA